MRSELVAVALSENPLIKQTPYTEASGRVAVDILRGKLLLLPTLSAASAIATTRVRAAKHEHISRLQEVKPVRDQVRESAVSNWITFERGDHCLRTIRSWEQLKRRFLASVTEEERIGQRTVLDVVEAQDDLTTAQVDLAVVKRHQVISAYGIVIAAGRLSAAQLAVSKSLYDPMIHYQEVRRKAWRTSITVGKMHV